MSEFQVNSFAEINKRLNKVKQWWYGKEMIGHERVGTRRSSEK
jgi:hypothetical protein